MFNKWVRSNLVAGAVGLCAFAAVSSQAMAETQVPLATWGGTNHVCVREFVPSMERALKELGPHTIKFQHFPGGQLGQDKDMPMSIPMGQVKFAWITVNGWTGAVPDTKVMDAPTGLTMKELDAIIEQPNGLFATLQKRFAAKNTTLLALADLGPPAIVSRDRLLTPQDFKGKKVRVFSEGQAEAVKSFGGAPVTIAFSEVYTAMQHGLIDAAIIGFQGVDSQKMYEVGKHVLVPASFLGTTMMGWAGNPQWLASMPANDRDVFLKAVRRAELENRQAIVTEIEQLTKQYGERGMTVTFLDPQMPEYAAWREATKPLLEKARKDLSPEVVALISQSK